MLGLKFYGTTPSLVYDVRISLILNKVQTNKDATEVAGLVFHQGKRAS